MKLIEVMPITDTEFLASNVPETDETEFDIATTYNIDDRVMVTTANVHKIYSSVLGTNLGNQPETDDGTNWLEVSATERWMAFDSVLGDTVVNAASITYSLQPSENISGLAFFGLLAATVQVQVTDTSEVEIYNQTINLVYTSTVIDWHSFFFESVVIDNEAIFVDVPGWNGFGVDVTISVSSGNAQVSQVVLGQVRKLGDTVDGTSIGIQDFSSKSRDTFGNSTIVERAFIDNVNFQFVLNTNEARGVKRILTRLRATAAVYFAHENIAVQGALVYGFFTDFSIPLSAGGKSFANLEIEGLT